jgi:hypothetical protein
MKMRSGFVSNSSSSSFVVLKRYVSIDQLDKILNHNTSCEQYGMSCCDSDKWQIIDHGEVLECCTSMNNFDLIEFITEKLGVPGQAIIGQGEF